MTDGITDMYDEQRIKPSVAAAIERSEAIDDDSAPEYDQGGFNVPDMVNSPSHYQGKVECIDAIEAALDGLHGMDAMCTGNAIKYLFRWKRKGGHEDLRKARWYINRILGDY